jgi:hypothetical protein
MRALMANIPKVPEPVEGIGRRSALPMHAAHPQRGRGGVPQAIIVAVLIVLRIWLSFAPHRDGPFCNESWFHVSDLAHGQT